MSEVTWAVSIDGDDVISAGPVLVTAFGGKEDAERGDDDGHTESGHDTAIRIGGPLTGFPYRTYKDTGLLCCALPIRSTERATRNSPLANPRKPHIPWGTLVKFWAGDEANPTFEIKLPLYDNGPDTDEYPDHAADFSKAAAIVAAIKLGMHIPDDRITAEFSARLSFRIIGGAAYV